MANFKKETLEVIAKSGHAIEDVMFIGSRDGKYRINIDKFLEISNFDYDAGFGAAAIATDLIIYFKDKSYVTRGEYDGSEWWEYNEPLNYNETDISNDFDCLGGDDFRWKTVDCLNREIATKTKGGTTMKVKISATLILDDSFNVSTEEDALEKINIALDTIGLKEIALEVVEE